MSTITAIVDRLYREYLEPPAALSGSFSFLNADIDDAVTSVVYDDGLFDVEVESRLGAGAVIEIDKELMIATAVNEGTQTLTVVRGALGTAAAAHTQGARLLAWPEVSRQEATDAVYDAVPALWPDLYGRGTISVTTELWSEIPENVVGVDKATILHDGKWWVIDDVELLTDFPPSTTETAVQWPAVVPSGLGGYLTYRVRPVRPTDDADDLTADPYHLRAEWESILVLDAASRVVGKLEPDSATLRFVSEQLKARNIEAGTATAVARALQRQRDDLRERYAKALAAELGSDAAVHRIL